MWQHGVEAEPSESGARSITLCCGHTISAEDIVEIVVGNDDDQESLSVPRKILTNKSAFFASCLSSGMLAGQNNKISLPNESPQNFQQLFECMCEAPGEDELSESDAENDEVIDCMKVYLLAERYGVWDVHNALTAMFGFTWVSRGIPPSQYAWIFHNLPETSALHRLATDTLAFFLANQPNPYRGEYDEDEEDSWTDEDGDGRYDGGIYTKQLQELLAMPGVGAKVLWLTLNAKGGENPTLAKFDCRYHVHMDGKTCNEN